MAQTKLNNSQLPDTLSSKTIDNTNDINTTLTRLKISGGTNGQVLSTDGSSNLSWTTAGGGGGANEPTILVVKSADETVTNSVTFQDDDHLTTTLDANSYYFGEIDLLLTRANDSAAPVFKFAIQCNSLGAFKTDFYPTAFVVMNGTAASGGINTVSLLTPQAPSLARITLAAKTSTSTEQLTLRFAQNSVNATGVTVMKGSCMKIWKRATV